jgi:hypothetical protein
MHERAMTREAGIISVVHLNNESGANLDLLTHTRFDIINPQDIANLCHQNNQSFAAITMSEKKKKQRWFPLESNPALINGYIEKLGYDTSLYEVCFENSMQS